MTSKSVKYAYTLHNPRSVPNGTIDGVVDMLLDILSDMWVGGFEMVEEAVEDARHAWRDDYGFYPGQGEYVAVAPYTPYELKLNIYRILDDIYEDAEETAGFAAQDWSEEIDELTEEDRQEIRGELQAVLREWLKKHGLEPNFGTVDTEKASYYPLWEGAGA